ncbi:MAG: MmgE/PrpD family protein, partial [Chloroflexota bacterium]
DDDLMLNALSVAGSHSSGLNEFTQTGGSVKRIHAGVAAFGGMRAALLARAGVSGPPTVLEGESGFWHAFSDEVRAERLTSGFGKDFVLMGTSYKRYACCHQLHAAIDATSKIVGEHGLKADDIESVVMGTNKSALRIVGTITEPKDVTESQFSATYGLALCVVKGGNGFSDYNEDNLKDPEIRKLARKVRLEVDEEAEAQFPAKRAVRVTVTTKDRKTYQQRLDGPRGTPENPLTRSQVQEKFRSLAAMVLPSSRAEEIVKAVQRLDTLGTVSTLSRLLVS